MIQNTILKFSKPKILLTQTHISDSHKQDKKVGILIQNTISKFSKTKNLTKKSPPKVPKNKKNIYKEASNQKVL